ncbi:5'-methylthioadenosine/S-adenosylhomocysteine nucleosidase family protein [Paenibacillus sp. FSL K6-2859]|jgi:nucleoside phosphorylase|uniref:5'-methylthioadenosine/S-adenosylhomocysteine nucleosidase family protein n=1 Tax=Paenibacillus sp. FSL K6-2859 TaxID=2921482 RepID=UPI0030F8D0C3
MGHDWRSKDTASNTYNVISDLSIIKNTPKRDIISSEKAATLTEDISLLVVTATEIETKTLFHHMKPLPGQKSLLLIYDNRQTYTVGLFGLYGVVHVQSAIGSSRRDGAINTLRDSISFWKPKAVLVVGIGFGIDDSKQKLGDILISETIANYEYARIEENRSSQRGAIVESGVTLLNRAKNHWDWFYTFPDMTTPKVQIGQFLSGEKLIDSRNFKNDLLDKYPSAIGGDMEGYGVASAANVEKLEWLVVKAISDWANQKSNGFQEHASDAAVSFCHSLFSIPYAFDCLQFKIL